SLGLLEAVTAKEEARFMADDAVRQEVEVEPLTNYLIVRARKDSNEGRTRIGAVFTALQRDLADPALRSRLHSSAYVAGVDLIREWEDGTWRISGSFSPSLVRGDEAAMI